MIDKTPVRVSRCIFLKRIAFACYTFSATMHGVVEATKLIKPAMIPSKIMPQIFKTALKSPMGAFIVPSTSSTPSMAIKQQENCVQERLMKYCTSSGSFGVWGNNYQNFGARTILSRSVSSLQSTPTNDNAHGQKEIANSTGDEETKEFLEPTPENPMVRVNGLFVVDKPLEWTSQDVVGYIRRILERDARDRGLKPAKAGRSKSKTKVVRVGHGGTLDPLASGVLVIGVGTGTKELQRYNYVLLRCVYILLAIWNVLFCKV